MKKILIIDDNEDNLISIKALLNNFIPDIEIILAQSGKEGIATTRKERPDTILLDIIMPEMDGYEVCQRLKEDEITKHIPIILLTAIKTDSKSRLKGLEIGADAFFSKPIDPEELSAQVNVMLRIKNAEDQLRTENADLEKLIDARTKDLSKTNKKLLLEISQRKLVEEELNRYRDQLEEKVKDRTAELEEKNAELEKFNKLFVDREFRIKELRNRIRELEEGNS